MHSYRKYRKNEKTILLTSFFFNRFSGASIINMDEKQRGC